jgi:thioredoxin-related protein
MKYISLLLFVPLLLSFTIWHNNLDEAKQLAKKEHKYILLNFSGSDWCGPCIRLHKEILETEAFLKFANNSLILVNADFPRLKKNQLPSAQQKINDAIADKYNSNGSFPFTVLLDANGKILKQWEGFPKVSPEEFAADIQSVIDANK